MFRLRLLDPMTTCDRDSGADLRHTLRIFPRTNGSWTRSAELLHLHVNTPRYRIARIEELTGASCPGSRTGSISARPSRWAERSGVAC